MKALVFGTRTQPYEPPAGYGDNKLVQ
ncbi:MAG: hypothetical protein QOF21_801, partial [Actinomycetota bacterium]